MVRCGHTPRNVDTMKANEDESYDIYFGPKAPKGKESNGITTGESLFLLFRLHEPDGKNWFKTWMWGDLEKVK